jgi:hypothetical protein
VKSFGVNSSRKVGWGNGETLKGDHERGRLEGGRDFATINHMAAIADLSDDYL